MKHYFIISAVLIFVAAFTLFSCNSGKKILKNVKANDTIKVAVSESIVINLVSNPSTGYRWKYTENENIKNIEFVSDVYTAPETDAIGAAGMQTFTFNAKKKGYSVLEFKYARGTGEPAQTHTVIIEITKE